MENENSRKTRRVKTSEISKAAKKTNKKKVKFKDKHPRIVTAIKIGIVVLMLLAIIGGGVLVGTFFGVFGDELKISEDSLVVGYENSTVYDADENLIATLSGGTKRKSVSLSEMSEYLPKAYVAIEDERFYSHNGIDIKRTTAATVTYIIHRGSSSFGGSTITQQVIKNITKEKENSALAGVVRKIKEISKAIQVEHYLTKEQILELYLNLIFVGGDDINGVELGSVYYFDKSAKDLSIAECAYLAGINHSPNAYKPFETYEGKDDAESKKQSMKEKIQKRTKTVLMKMKELNYINEEQYNEAVSEVDAGLNFKQGESSSVTTDMSYHTAAAIDQILDQIMEENEDMSRDMAEMNLYSSGYKIYTTQKTDIQKRVEEEVVKSAYITKTTITDSKTNEKVVQYSMPTMVIIDHSTGNVVAASAAKGSSDERTAITKLGYLNIPTSLKKQTGSSMKPISVIAPGLESGAITGATVYDDNPTTFPGTPVWTPKEWYPGYKGLMTMRTAIEVSANIPHAKALADIGLDKSIKFCQSVGLPKFDNEGLSLALGGLSEGVSTFEMAGAYSAIANDGVYNTPTFYTKVTDKTDKTIYEPKKESNRVMTEQNNFIEKDILTQTVLGASGTATYCKISGIDVAAKTGTTNGDNDRWLCGFTPYYTATVWYGYEKNATVKASGNPAGKIWAAVMKDIHKDLPNAKFEEPEGIVRASVCKTSGKLATEACGGNVYTELFTADTVPTESCEGHVRLRICVETGLIANDSCPQVEERLFTARPEHENTTKWTTTGGVYDVPTETCTIHTGAPAPQPSTPTPEQNTPTQSTNPTNNNPVHSHSYSTVASETAATCTTAGSRTLKCSCGETKTEVIPAKGHTSGSWIVDSEATATTAGFKHQICSVCGATIKTEAIPATGPATPPPANTTPPQPTTNTTGQ